MAGVRLFPAPAEPAAVSRDAIVVGGGIVGASVGYHLAAAGEDVLLLDRADDGRATDAGAGIVAPATSSRTGSEPWFRLAAAAAEHYPDLVERLAAATDGPVGYDRTGMLAVATSGAEVGAFEASLDRIRDRQERLGHPREGSVMELDPDAAADRFPPLGTVERAFHYEDAARVRGPRLTEALLDAGRECGLMTETDNARELLRDGGGAIKGVRARRKRYEAPDVVIAGGAWSGRWADRLGVEVPVRPQRGQLAHLEVEGPAAGWPVVTAFRGHYLVPWGDDRVVAGATREDGTGFDDRATAGGVREVLDEALRVAPGLADATLAEVRVGLRPASPDGLPILGAVPGVEGTFLATGHGPTGLTLGPYSGKLVADLVRGVDPGVDLAAFAPDRFAGRRRET